MAQHQDSTQRNLPYQDSTLPVEKRVSDLLSRMTLEDKAGMMFHSMIGYDDPTVANEQFALPAMDSLITTKKINHFNVIGNPGSTRQMVEWYNKVQEIAGANELAIPVSISSDPRHSFTDNPLSALMTAEFSQWPEPLGMSAINSEDVMEEFGDIARQEYNAVGIRVALHPQIDIATDPRWGRTNGTFGEDPKRVTKLGVAYVKGFQGENFGEESVSTMVKHFPGGGPQKDGEDPHFSYGKEQIYPGNNFDEHLEPFKAVFKVGARQVMPYYGMPVGTKYEEVGFGFNKGIITDLLRKQLGYDGIVCTDWGLFTDSDIMGKPLPARAWGVEKLDRSARMLKSLEAGADQFGGEHCPEVLVELVKSGKTSEARLDESVARLLKEKFLLGLFDDKRQLDVTAAEKIVGNDKFKAAGLEAQKASLTLLTNKGSNGEAILPLQDGIKVYLEDIPAESLQDYATVVDKPEDADVAILRQKAPYEPREGFLESMFHAGSIDFSDDVANHINEIAAKVPTIVDLYLDRPAILTKFADNVNAIICNYGASDEAIFEVMFGKAEPKGSLPFDMPSSMQAVKANKADVPFDTKDPLFQHGHGLGYKN
ncbi:MAG: glycoside hydrolase family 3 N-terminal domain-containing protein [Micrococcaceae bacterium]